MRIIDIFNAVNELAPFSTALEFDNPGLLVGNGESAVTGVVVSLDVTPEAVSYAKSVGAELIVSHHPVIFDPLKSLREDDIPYILAKNGIAAICAHTNYDMAVGGVNDVLAELAGLKGEILPLSEDGSPACGRIGNVDETPFEEYCIAIKNALGAGCIKACGKGTVRRVAVVGGSGGSELMTAIACGADTLVTGELKYNNYLDAKRLGLNVITAGHYATEYPAMPVLKNYLEKKFPSVVFSLWEGDGGYRVY